MTNAGVIISHSFTTSNTMEIIISFVPSENMSALESEKKIVSFQMICIWKEQHIVSTACQLVGVFQQSDKEKVYNLTKPHCNLLNLKLQKTKYSANTCRLNQLLSVFCQSFSGLFATLFSLQGRRTISKLFQMVCSVEQITRTFSLFAMQGLDLLVTIAWSQGLTSSRKTTKIRQRGKRVQVINSCCKIFILDCGSSVVAATDKQDLYWSVLLFDSCFSLAKRKPV